VGQVLHRGGPVFASLSALTPQGTTSFAAECIEDTDLEQISYVALSQRAATSLPWQTALTQAMLTYSARKEARERELLTLAPAQRYQLMLSQSPDLVQRVRQADLARYLGVTPVSLSRIKAREGSAMNRLATRAC
jgi:CRP-like cAMP-binding protein